MLSVELRRWTVDEYHQMIEAGILTPDDRVELIDGEIIRKSPNRPPHAATVQNISDYLTSLLVGKAHIRMQLPITLSTSEPEPDIAIVRWRDNRYVDRHPMAEDILWLIEVSHTTLAFDRGRKGVIYAREGIPEYWVLDVRDRQVYVYTNPTQTGYGQEAIVSDNGVLALPSDRQVQLPVAGLFLPPM